MKEILALLMAFLFIQSALNLKFSPNKGPATEQDLLIQQNQNSYPFNQMPPSEFNTYYNKQNSDVLTTYNTLMSQILYKKQLLLQQLTKEKANLIQKNETLDTQNYSSSQIIQPNNMTTNQSGNSSSFQFKQKETSEKINKTKNESLEIEIEDNVYNKKIESLINATYVLNNNVRNNFNILLNEIVKLKQENLELKKQSLAIQNDIKPFLKSILDMQLYSFNNINTYKATISKMASGLTQIQNKFFTDINEIKTYLNKTLIGTPEEKRIEHKGNIFADVLHERIEKIPIGPRFIEKKNKISLRKNSKNSVKNLRKEANFLDP